MHHRSSRGLALIAVTALLGGGALTSATQAASAAPELPTRSLQTRSILDPILSLILLGVLGQTITQLQDTLAGLTSNQIGDLLGAASPLQLTKLLSALNTTQMFGAMDTLDATELNTVIDALTAAQTGSLLAAADPAQLTGLLGVLDVTQLTNGLGVLDAPGLTDVVSALSPAQITGLLGSASGTSSVLTGLLGTATGLGATPGSVPLSSLLGQVNAVLGNGLPALPGQLTDLGSLLSTVTPLLDTAGLDSGLLATLLTTATGVLGGAPAGSDTGALQGLVNKLRSILSPPPPPAGGGGTTPGASIPGAGTTPGGSVPGAGINPGPGTPAVFTAYRAALGKIIVAKNRRRAKAKLSCPASAPVACVVVLSGKIAGRRTHKPIVVVMLRKTSKTVAIRFDKRATKRLKQKGGSLRLTAQTALSTLASVSKTVKVKTPRKR